MFAAIVIIVAGGFLDSAELKLGEGAGVSGTDYGDLPSGGGGGRFGGDGCHSGCGRVLFGACCWGRMNPNMLWGNPPNNKTSPLF